jgi:hypothetical protein
MLGMSRLALRDSALAYSALSLLCDAKEQRLSMSFERVDQGRIIREPIEHFGFSDSVIILSRSDTEDDAYAMGLLCTEFFYKAISFGVPLRGGIAHGEIIHNPGRGLIVGPALVNAVCIGEKTQWLGIVLDQHTAGILRALPLESTRNKPICIPHDVPMKGGRMTSWVLDWVEPHYDNIKALPWRVENFYSEFSKFGGPYANLPEDVRIKYRNTVEFINLPRG